LIAFQIFPNIKANYYKQRPKNFTQIDFISPNHALLERIHLGAQFTIESLTELGHIAQGALNPELIIGVDISLQSPELIAIILAVAPSLRKLNEEQLFVVEINTPQWFFQPSLVASFPLECVICHSSANIIGDIIARGETSICLDAHQNKFVILRFEAAISFFKVSQ